MDRSRSPEFKEVSRALQQRGKIISLTGPSKTGKTVISVNQILKDRSPIQVHGSKISSVEAFWSSLRAELRLPKKTTLEKSRSEKLERTSSGNAGLHIADQAELSLSSTRSRAEQTETSSIDEYDTNSVEEVEAGLKKLGSPIVIDDFHWVTDNDLQIRLIKSLRPLLQSGISIILTSVTELKDKPWRAVPDLALLCTDVKIPHWTFDQLTEIARLGFDALGAEIDDRVFRVMARFSYRNPMLMQDYCGRLAYALEIDQTLVMRRRFTVSDDQLVAVLRFVAEDKGRLYAKYCEGRGESNWPVISGRLVTIYILVALALSRVWVMTPIGIDALTKRMRKLLASESDRLRINNGIVSQTAEKISREMLADLETRAPLSFDQASAQLNILDPFFKAYLTWQLTPKYLNEHPPISSGEPLES